jgi:hypothetical protein
VHEKIAPHTCAARNKLAQLLSKSTPAAPHSEHVAESAPDSAPPPAPGAAAPGKPASNQAYRLVAPATVLIRGDRGMGTGVVIDPKGFVLTNYHVAADAQKKDFIYTVDVSFGDMTATGRMTRQEKSYEAVVVKADPVRDIAILKVKDPPANLTAIKMAKNAPQIGEKVMAVGHAGLGFLWAAKQCSIASVGERQQDSAMIAAFDCQHLDPSLNEKEAEYAKKSCEEQKKRMTDALAAKTQGLAIQTDCAITHGDSGGPLVNQNAEMVGLNQSISVDYATAGFHVHIDELREFTTKYGEEPLAILPDPYCDGGFDPVVEDIDLDGIPETLVNKGGFSLFGFDRMSILIDLDQNTHTKKHDDSNPFEAEIGMLITREGTYVWHDVDDNGKFDVLLFDKDNDGVPEQAYRLDGEGHVKEDKSLLPDADLSAKLVKDASLHARLGKIATAIGGVKYASRKLLAAASMAELKIPDAYGGVGTQGRVMDSDANGKPDLAFMRGTFSRGMLIDADEHSLGSMKDGDDAADIVKQRKVDAEVAVVVQANAIWAMYDTDNDKKFDLVLMTTQGSDPSMLFTTNAWKVNGNEKTPAPDQVGRKLFRPSLIPSMPRVQTALRFMLADMATDEGFGSVPATTGIRYRYHPREIKGVMPNTVIEAFSGSSTVMLVDVDHDTKIPPKTDVQKVVNDGKFDAEVAVIHKTGAEGGSDWIYYDTDNDGKFDLILFVPGASDAPSGAWRMKKGATALEADPSAIAGKPLRTKSVFTNKAIAAKWKVLAKQLFKPASVEE